MRSILLTLLIILIFINPLISQDSLVNIDELTFKTEFEKKVITDIGNNKAVPLFNLYYATADTVVQSQIDEYNKQIGLDIKYLKEKFAKTQKNKKKIKLLYKLVHNKYLKIYNDDSYFHQIFSNEGNYNCLSATALFTIFLEGLNIPYTINESPTHVNLIAYHNTTPTIIETTSPSFGYFTYNETYMKLFVNALLDDKIISKTEVEQKGIHKIFEEFYFSDDPVNPIELAGLQYYNYAVQNMNDEDTEECLKNISKAYYLYPDDRNRFILVTALDNIIVNGKYSSELEHQSLIQYANFVNHGITSGYFIEVFEVATYKIFIEKGDEETYTKLAEKIIDNIHDSVCREEALFIFHYEKGRVAANRNNFEAGIKHMQEAIRIKPGHLDAKNILTFCVANELTTWESKDIIEKWDQIMLDSPILLENIKFQSIYYSTILEEAFNEFRKDNAKVGLEMLDLFEEKYIPGKKLDRRLYSQIDNAYAESAGYYFRKGNIKKAQEMVSNGLKYNDNARRLNNMKEAMSNFN